MFMSGISNTKLHCCLVILILSVITLLLSSLLIFWKANQRIVGFSGGYDEDDDLESSFSNHFRGSIGGVGVGTIKKIGSQTEFAQTDNTQTLKTSCAEFAKQANLSIIPDEVQCPTGSFACKICPKICILQSGQCDQIPDCPDFSDETLCTDYTGSLESFYSRIPKPETLKQLTNFTNMTTLDIPKSCTMNDVWLQQCKCNLSEIEIVYCERYNLTEVPLLPDSIWKLNLNNNLIDDIDQVLWPRNLTVLNLENNLLTKISDISFRDAKNLSKLHLSDNQISSIDLNAFKGLNNLVRLNLPRNKLKTFDTRLIEWNKNLIGLVLTGNEIDLFENTTFGNGKFPVLEDLDFDYNEISIIRKNYFSNFSSLALLSLRNNKIEHIEIGSFNMNLNLRELNLISNNIHHLERMTFSKNLPISKLRLAMNPLESFPSDLFRELLDLESLDFTGIDFDNITITRSYFNYLTKLKYITFSSFHYCHFASNARVCKPSTDGLSSSQELLAFPILKIAVWIVALVCIIGNVLVFIWRLLSPHEDETLSLFIRNLSIADLMMGLYLATIGLADYKFEKAFKLWAIDWMSSKTCTGIGFLAMFSSELSVFILTIITIERYRSIVCINKFDGVNKRMFRARLYITVAWILSFLIASYPLIEWYMRQSDSYATNALCLPLHIDQPYSRGWLYSAIVYLGINFLAVIIIMYLYLRMYWTIIKWRQLSRPAFFLENNKQTNQHNHDHHYDINQITDNDQNHSNAPNQPIKSSFELREDTILAVRFFFIVVTDCLCWVPIVIIKILALQRISISSTIYGWLVVFIIPINSALNPIVYTLAAPTTLRDTICRWFQRIFLKLDNLTTISTSTDKRQSADDGLMAGVRQNSDASTSQNIQTFNCATKPQMKSSSLASNNYNHRQKQSSYFNSSTSSSSNHSSIQSNGIIVCEAFRQAAAAVATGSRNRRNTRGGSQSTGTCDTLDTSLRTTTSRDFSKIDSLEREDSIEGTVKTTTFSSSEGSPNSAKLSLKQAESYKTKTSFKQDKGRGSMSHKGKDNNQHLYHYHHVRHPRSWWHWRRRWPPWLASRLDILHNHHGGSSNFNNDQNTSTASNQTCYESVDHNDDHDHDHDKYDKQNTCYHEHKFSLLSNKLNTRRAPNKHDIMKKPITAPNHQAATATSLANQVDSQVNHSATSLLADKTKSEIPDHRTRSSGLMKTESGLIATSPNSRGRISVNPNESAGGGAERRGNQRRTKMQTMVFLKVLLYG